MSQKIPAIVATTEGASLIVEDGVTGFIVERDASSIADAIKKLYLNESLRERMGCESRTKY